MVQWLTACWIFFIQRFTTKSLFFLGSFLVGNDGKVYEGVGWHVQDLHTQGYNNVSLGIAFFGSKIGNVNFLQTQKVAYLLPLLAFANAYIFVTILYLSSLIITGSGKPFCCCTLCMTCRFFLIYGWYVAEAAPYMELIVMANEIWSHLLLIY